MMFTTRCCCCRWSCSPANIFLFTLLSCLLNEKRIFIISNKKRFSFSSIKWNSRLVSYDIVSWYACFAFGSLDQTFFQCSSVCSLSFEKEIILCAHHQRFSLLYSSSEILFLSSSHSLDMMMMMKTSCFQVFQRMSYTYLISIGYHTIIISIHKEIICLLIPHYVVFFFSQNFIFFSSSTSRISLTDAPTDASSTNEFAKLHLIRTFFFSSNASWFSISIHKT